MWWNFTPIFVKVDCINLNNFTICCNTFLWCCQGKLLSMKSSGWHNIRGIPKHYIKSTCHEHKLVNVYVYFGPWKLRLCDTAKCILEEGGQDIKIKSIKSKIYIYKWPVETLLTTLKYSQKRVEVSSFCVHKLRMRFPWRIVSQSQKFRSVAI